MGLALIARRCAILLGSVTQLCRQLEHTCLEEKSAPAFCPKSCW